MLTITLTDSQCGYFRFHLDVRMYLLLLPDFEGCGADIRWPRCLRPTNPEHRVAHFTPGDGPRPGADLPAHHQGQLPL